MEKINFKYNLTKEIDSNYSKGDNLGYIDILVGDEVIDSYNVYLEDDIFNKNQTSDIIITIIFIFVF